MMNVCRWENAVVGGALLTLISSAGAQGITEKAKIDETVSIRSTDQLMEQAKRKGKASLPEFLTLASAPKPGMKNFSLKVGVLSQHGREFVWVRPFVKDGDHYSGKLRNTVETIPNKRYGDSIAFDEKDIVDWMYFEDGKMRGNFTACALLKTAAKKKDRDAFKNEYGLDCEAQ